MFSLEERSSFMESKQSAANTIVLTAKILGAMALVALLLWFADSGGIH